MTDRRLATQLALAAMDERATQGAGVEPDRQPVGEAQQEATAERSGIRGVVVDGLALPFGDTQELTGRLVGLAGGLRVDP